MKKIYAILTALILLSSTAFATQDITSPNLDAFSISPVSIDTSNGDRTIDISMSISDALSGFSQGFMIINTPGNCEAKYLYFGLSNLSTGTANSGTYVVPVSWPQYSCTGSWKIVNLHLKDKVGNLHQFYYKDAAFLGYSTVGLF
jgi:hypothetical protein